MLEAGASGIAISKSKYLHIQGECMKEDKLKSAEEALRKDPSERNWKALASALKASSAKYYRVIYENEGKLDKVQDLKKSYAELYDSKYKKLAKVPICIERGKRVSGATIYLKGLSVINGLVK